LKVIIIAAGVGSRLGDLTKNLPKPLLDVNGKSILEHQIELFRKFGIEDIVIVTGHKKEKFRLKDVKYVHNPNYLNVEQAGSLMSARNEIVGNVIISFGDIIFDELVLATDQKWEESYQIRTENSPKFSDFVAVKDKQIIKFFKNSEEFLGKYNIVEFIGLMKLSEIGSKKIIQKYEYLEKNQKGKFHYAPSFKKAKIIDLLEELRLNNIEIKIQNISGNWCEIDTNQDLEIAKKFFK
jgi:choline kinase